MRDRRIDFLRFLGLTMIIVAHTDPPAAIFQLRNFDVPLMVFVSALAASASNRVQTVSFGEYFLSRAYRLVAPVWIFFCGYFSISFWLNNSDTQYSIKTMASTFLLFNGVGYVWIIRVFVLIALITPTLIWLNKKIKDDFQFGAFILTTLCINEAFLFTLKEHRGNALISIVENTLFYAVTYGAVFLLGLRISQRNGKFVFHALGLCLIIFLGLAVFLWELNSSFAPTQGFKYPPQIYYLSYALFISLGLYLMFPKIQSNALVRYGWPIVNFYSTNSIWIYLWHIPFILHIEHSNFFLDFLIVFSGASSVFLLQYVLVKFFLKKASNSNRLGYLKVLLG